MMTPEQAEAQARAMAMRAAHHAYCRDTGCFDGDDISNPDLDAALDRYAAIIRARSWAYVESHKRDDFGLGAAIAAIAALGQAEATAIEEAADERG